MNIEEEKKIDEIIRRVLDDQIGCGFPPVLQLESKELSAYIDKELNEWHTKKRIRNENQ